ncbi:excisionase family DNA binding protein [Corynebacterium mucifaciens]|uniref:helix-turn-helix domain-containing protein n=1 Tax=Corynebacterium ureicelerivorans TaxID=401472 RepID=UPI00069084B0|nr:helix-turn-helix domain-containing protein [Corynebacterium ureicelerivorans]MCT1370359.1 helix-turn-helix domain-containing protein [Corynebacterium mucifaciens]MDN8605973.1 helix-turn-helix domain-containing protein [Corynebacterium ureicelerivorans]MDN8626279.1 helix-turn-helix domain-containing protein [Corynebacterium ureicelerivorans]
MQEQQSPVEAALAELNANLAVARTQSEDHVVLPKQTAVWVRDLLEDMAEGRLVRPPEPDEEMTTQQVANLLGVSRPFVVKLIDEGRLPGHKVGTHRRVYTRDAHAYKQRMG